jgi:hypothetical protein
VIFHLVNISYISQGSPTGGGLAIAGVLVIGAAALAILVVRDTTARQDRKNDLIASGQIA